MECRKVLALHATCLKIQNKCNFLFQNNESCAWNCTGFSVFWVFYKPFFLVCFSQAKYDHRNTTPSFFERLISSGRNDCLHAKTVFSFSYCVPTYLFDYKFLFYVLLFCFLSHCTWPTMGQKGFVLLSLSFKFMALTLYLIVHLLASYLQFFQFCFAPCGRVAVLVLFAKLHILYDPFPFVTWRSWTFLCHSYLLLCYVSETSSLAL